MKQRRLLLGTVALTVGATAALNAFGCNRRVYANTKGAHYDAGMRPDATSDAPATPPPAETPPADPK